MLHHFRSLRPIGSSNSHRWVFLGGADVALGLILTFSSPLALFAHELDAISIMPTSASSVPTPQKTPQTTTIENYQTDRNGRPFRTNNGLQPPHQHITTVVTVLLINRFRVQVPAGAPKYCATEHQSIAHQSMRTKVCTKVAHQSSQALRTHASQLSRPPGNDTKIQTSSGKSIMRNPSPITLQRVGSRRRPKATCLQPSTGVCSSRSLF